MTKYTRKNPSFFLIAFCAILMSVGCKGSNSEISNPSLQAELTSLKSKVFSLEESINLMRGKNSDLEAKLQALEKQIYAINAKDR